MIRHYYGDWRCRPGTGCCRSPCGVNEPKVEVALDNQTRFLEWVAQGALSATAEASDGFKADKAKKPWLVRPTYLAVLDSALKAQ